jgi:hypothetical protein
MLTIENILKLEGRPLADGWTIQLIYEGRPDTYIFELVKDLGSQQDIRLCWREPVLEVLVHLTYRTSSYSIHTELMYVSPQIS